ncbi:hypothetical protein HDV05_001923 [Chytridiales sp. JEL 0842]|nr:hypothetical protein HDV05_001923 [Chytridiales sp. JEL 0842]
MTIAVFDNPAFTTNVSKDQKTVNSKPFPYLITPSTSASGARVTKDDLLEFAKHNKDNILNLMIEYGAVVFRGFPLESGKDFQDVLDCLEMDELPYVGGAAPRYVVYKNVVTTNEAPPEAVIPFHHEMAQVPVYPTKVFFFCETAASEGGQTPILPSFLAYQKIKERQPEFIRKLEEKGVIYTRVLPAEDDPSSPIGRGWKSTFQTTDKAVAAEKAKDLGVRLEWLPNGDVKSISGVTPAVKIYHGKAQFFNSVVAAYTGWKDSRNDPTTAVTYGDGEKLDPVAVEDAKVVMDEICSNWRWEKGDLMMIDNEQVMHARRSFAPPRRVLASLYK